MKNRLVYETPEAEALVFRMEGNFCATVNPTDRMINNPFGDLPEEEEEW